VAEPETPNQVADDLPDDLFVLSNRGFVQGRPIPSAYGGAVKVYESSAAEAPHVWVMVWSPVNLNEPDGPSQEAVAHLTLDNAIRLRDQLGHLTTRMVNDWGVETHHHGDREYTTGACPVCEGVTA
jgi:hypothetical protein